MKKIIDYFDITQDCLFSKFLNPVWIYAFPDASELDSYFLLRFGGRLAFDAIMDKYANESGKITGNDLKKLADMIYHINARKWERLFMVYNADYTPWENTDVYEDVIENNAGTGKVKTDSTNTFTPGSTVTNKKAGFNSSTPVVDATSETSGEDSTVLDSTVESESERNATKQLRKHGNIGVMENTTMLRHEVEFWKWTFIDAICKDICDIIALSIY